MDQLLSLTLQLSEENNEEYYTELLKIIEERYGVTLSEILESQNQLQFNTNIYHALDMLMIDPIKWCNLDIARNDPNLDINFVNELKKYTCQFKNKRCFEMKDATENNHFMCFKYLYENGPRYFISNVLDDVVVYGRLEFLKYLHEKGHPLKNHLCYLAVTKGHFECLKYLHKNGCQLENYLCSAATKRGDLECLKYLHKNGCQFDDEACMNAFIYDNLECLKYAIENGCPYEHVSPHGLTGTKCYEYLQSLSLV